MENPARPETISRACCPIGYRMLKLHAMDVTWQQTQNVYGHMKDYNPLLSWASGTAEDVTHRASIPRWCTSTTACSSWSTKPWSRALTASRTSTIRQIPRSSARFNTEKVCELRQAFQQKATSLKELSRKKANEVLASQYGSIAVDTTAQLAECLLDYLFPKCEGDDDDDAPISVKNIQPCTPFRV